MPGIIEKADALAPGEGVAEVGDCLQHAGFIGIHHEVHGEDCAVKGVCDIGRIVPRRTQG